MADLVLRLDKRELRALTDVGNAWLFGGHKSPPLRAAVEKARAALDSPPVEEGSEYRVVGKRGERLVELSMVESPSQGEEITDLYRNGGVYTQVRIQSRIITQLSDGSTLITPWSDLEGEGEQ